MDPKDVEARLALVRQAGVPVSKADESRIAASVVVSLKSLAQAAPGSIFDTEPAHFDRLLKEK